MVTCVACTVHVHVTLQNFRACLKQVVNLSTLSPSSGWGEKEKHSSPQLVPHTELCCSLSSLSLHLELLAQLGLLGDDVHHLLCPLSCREALPLQEHLHKHLELLPRHVLEHLGGGRGGGKSKKYRHVHVSTVTHAIQVYYCGYCVLVMYCTCSAYRLDTETWDLWAF